MPVRIIIAPTVEPLELPDVHAHCRVENYDDDAYLQSLIVSARDAAQSITGRQLMTTTIDLYLDEFPDSDDEIEIPYPPLQSITSIQYIDENGATQTMSSANYLVDTVREPGNVSLAYGQTSWPSTRDVKNAVIIRFVCGYASADLVPQPIKHWMLMRIGTMYAQREATTNGPQVSTLHRSFVDGLLDPYLIPNA